MTQDTSAPADGASSHQLGEISREEWIRRYADRIDEQAGGGAEFALETARTGAEEYEEQERACGNPVVWWGGPSGAHNTPEDQADEELSYWDSEIE